MLHFALFIKNEALLTIAAIATIDIAIGVIKSIIFLPLKLILIIKLDRSLRVAFFYLLLSFSILKTRCKGRAKSDTTNKKTDFTTQNRAFLDLHQCNRHFRREKWIKR